MFDSKWAAIIHPTWKQLMVAYLEIEGSSMQISEPLLSSAL